MDLSLLNSGIGAHIVLNLLHPILYEDLPILGDAGDPVQGNLRVCNTGYRFLPTNVMHRNNEF